MKEECSKQKNSKFKGLLQEACRAQGSETRSGERKKRTGWDTGVEAGVRHTRPCRTYWKGWSLA